MEKKRILMDTSAYSAFLGGHEGIKFSLQQAEEIIFNPVVLGELIAGFPLGKMKKGIEPSWRTFYPLPG